MWSRARFWIKLNSFKFISHLKALYTLKQSILEIKWHLERGSEISQKLLPNFWMTFYSINSQMIKTGCMVYWLVGLIGLFKSCNFFSTNCMQFKYNTTNYLYLNVTLGDTVKVLSTSSMWPLVTLSRPPLPPESVTHYLNGPLDTSIFYTNSVK